MTFTDDGTLKADGGTLEVTDSCVHFGSEKKYTKLTIIGLPISSTEASWSSARITLLCLNTVP